MALDDEFRKQGEWLFRWRSFLPLVLIPLIGVAIAQTDVTAITPFGEKWDYICLAISFLGLFVRAFTRTRPTTI